MRGTALAVWDAFAFGIDNWDRKKVEAELKKRGLYDEFGEISTRLALGATRWHVMRQIFSETALLSFLGGALGLVLAFWGTRLLIYFVVAGAKSTALDASPDFRVLAFTFGVSLLTGLVFGIAPALRASRLDVVPSLSPRGRDSGASERVDEGP